MTSNAPVPFSGDFAPINFEGAAPAMPQRPFLRIDHGSGEHSVSAGTFNYCGASIRDVNLVLAASRDFRHYYEADYNTDPKAPMVCMSWDGKNAYGKGGRDPRAPLQDRLCMECPMARAKGKEWCAPQSFYLGMLTHATSDVWMPFFIEVRGVNVRPWADAMRLAQSKAMSTMRKLEGGGAAPRLPAYTWVFRPQLIKIKGKSGYECNFGTPQEALPPDAQYIATFLSTMGKAMWDDERAAAERRARGIGSEKQAQVSGQNPPGVVAKQNPNEAEPDSYDQVPF
jgi:hypothetical protein